MRQRLKARPEPKVHPDPDLLTAYIERALPPGERSQVVQHLAECGYCREIVSLSLPGQPEQVVAPPVPVRSRWWNPVYRWGAVAATIAVAVTLVVEKPWKPSSKAFERPTTISDNSQAAVSSQASAGASTVGSPANTKPATESAATVVEPPKTPLSLASNTPVRGAAGAGGPAFREDRRVAEGESPNVSRATIGGVIGGARQAPVAASAPPPPSVTATQAEPASAMQVAVKDAEQDYVNRTILSSQGASTTAEKSKVPEAPSPRETAAAQDAARARKSAPKITSQSLVASAMDMPVVPPSTKDEQSAPSPADSTLAKSGGFAYGLKSTLNKAVSKTVTTVKKGTKSAISAPFSLAAPSAVSSLVDADRQTDKAASERILWSITPDGKLLRSTDVGQWHEVNPPGADLRFRVVEPHHGPEVWVGGDHGTLIHSWNAGVNWSQLNVPDSTTSDITGISIDGDNVQVKTSNGQTFVSNDHGKTWVPLQQQPQ